MSHAYPAPAKLNLFLHVVGRRADGYHLLQSVFRLIDRADTVHLELSDDGQVVRVGDLPGVAEDDDLTVRAARLLQTHAPEGAGVRIRLEKVLPMGGGLGGGSSDAATVLLALNRLWQVNLPRQKLQQLALQLGADVPVFIYGQTAFAEGVGEILSPVSVPPAWYVVLMPPVQVPTAAIFAAPELTRNTSALKMARFSAGMGRNDLQPVVVSRYPEVGRSLEWLAQFGVARMTGSGACVFAVFEAEDAAWDVLRQLPETMQGFVAQGLDRHPLFECGA
ncbi:MAG TPA: 4-(cytidine 5'-diphospho)-2-C-methyl-D-erythritol kinase [Thiobacillus sp.]|nr:MAG: 4-(cytidine 5'-diphospho)-2-C-methyl-D-erythritol kinase [Hydrogenophilales bacterium 28-61-11]OZA42878.1 MAG: 4-(cytidine 5'-diphospho)-2-C-methyl-D-erythritol kinase [Hydrogenophilales bacterium 17-61-76]HQT31731.1 4-(cytidine 5'-diphospho)-2-C-methyl-D-erythritol kinase [Thiobacillus sp.]HQT69654.1 4-(cytidine 5'-diphospho)-2-C-methyl-D-erythritol kinase [Thiobacillus sp.]